MNALTRAYQSVKKAVGQLQGIDDRSGSRGWWPVIREPFSGAWQRNIEWTNETVLAYFAVYRCITLIANDIGNMPIGIKEKNTAGIWNPVEIPSKSPVLNAPNRYQNHIQFKQWWATSKLINGNTYVLKVRDNRREVVNLYVLDPCGAQVLVSPDGSVYYQFKTDNLTGIKDSEIAFPASEIIHDRMNCLFHPLVGVSPLFACGMAAANGLKMQTDSSLFFANGANPGGVLTAPGAISDETAKRLQEKWTANYTGENSGKVAVMGDGLRFEPMRMKYADAQLIEQMKFTAEMVCSAFGVPAYKTGMGSIPAGAKVGDLEMMYYNSALHTPIEEMEACLDDALGLNTKERRVELDLDTLLRMDPATMATVQTALVGGGISTPNEARLRFNMPPLEGGNTVYMQQQDIPLSEASKNTIQQNAAPVAAPEEPTAPEETPEDIAEKQMKELMAEITKGLTNV